MPAPPAPGTGIIRTGALSMVGIAALGITRLIHSTLVGRAVGPDEWGRIGVLLAAATIASLLLPAGVASATAKFIPYLQGRGEAAAARTAYRLLSRLGLAGAVLLGVGAAALVAAWYEADPVDVAQVGALTIAFSAYTVEKQTLYGFARVPAYARLELCTSALAIVTTVVVVASGSTLYLVPLALGYTVFAIVARWLVRNDARGPAPGLGPVPPRELFGFIALACLGTLASQGFLQGTVPLAEAFATPAEVGYFTTAVALVTPLYFLPRALGLALFPSMARSHGAGDIEGVRRQADLSTRALLVVLAPVFAVAILLARPVLVLLFGRAYEPGTPVLQLMLAATFLAVCAVAAVNALSSGERWQVRTPVGWAVAGCVTGLAVVAVLGGPLGATGVGIGYLAGTALTASGPVLAVWRKYRMPWGMPVALALAVVVGSIALGVLVRALGATGGRQFALDLGTALGAGALSVGLLIRPLTSVLRTARHSSIKR